MSPLHVESRGGDAREVPELVLIHGWGLHGGVWDEVAGDLETDFRLWCVDLPGHGYSPLDQALRGANYTLPGLARVTAAALGPKLNGPAWWLGWSLGGLVTLQMALDFPEQVRGLVTVATTPRFVTAPDWPSAVGQELLAGFAEDLARDYRATLLRFLALQARGGDHAREDVRRLRERVFARGEPNAEALRGGLNILGHTDLRARLAEIAPPLLALGGERDMLVPPAAITALAVGVRDGRVAIIRGAGHAPFLSDRTEFVMNVKQFIDAGNQ